MTGISPYQGRMPGGPGNRLRIVYNNDPHEKPDAMPHWVNGFRYFSEEAHAQGMDVLRLNGGDNNVGKERTDWLLTVLQNNMLHLHAAAKGNHEMDLGTRDFSDGLRWANYPTLVRNIDVPKGNSLQARLKDGRLKEHAIVIQGQDASYGIIGVTTPEMKTYLSADVDLEKLKVEDFEETVEEVAEEVKALEAKGIKRIILVSHMGYALEKKLAERTHGIDVIVGGHSHDVFDGVVPGVNWVRSKCGKPVLILQAGKNGKYFGVADVAFDKGGVVQPLRNQIYHTAMMPADPQAEALKNQFLGPARYVANIMTPYNNDNNAFEEDVVAGFAADASRRLSGADIAFVGGFEIRNSLEPGAFNSHQLDALMPFGDQMVRISMTGREIWKMLSRCADALKRRDTHPGLVDPSGLVYEVFEKTGTLGRVWVQNRFTGGWDSLEPNKRYSVAVGEFSVKNKKNIPELHLPERVDWRSGLRLRDIFRLGLQQAGAPYRPIGLYPTGRIRVYH